MIPSGPRQRFTTVLSDSRTVSEAIGATIREGHAFFEAAASVGSSGLEPDEV